MAGVQKTYWFNVTDSIRAKQSEHWEKVPANSELFDDTLTKADP